MATPEADDRAARQYALAVFWDAALGFWRRGAKSTAWPLTISWLKKYTS